MLDRASSQEEADAGAMNRGGNEGGSIAIVK